MAVQWFIERKPISTPQDIQTILDLLAYCEENGRDLEYVIKEDGALLLFFKKKD